MAQQKVRDAYEDEGRRLFNFIRSRVPTNEDAEDILQDVFFQLSGTGETIQSIERVNSWLFRVARNRIIDWYRKKKTVSWSDHAGRTDDDEGGYLLEEVLPSNLHGPDADLWGGAVMETVEESLAKLPAEQAEVFVMHEMDGLSFKQIADITGELVNTLISRKRYAVKFLREELAHFYDELNER